MKEIRVAVVGNPNSGKSTLINAICGTNLKVGNWPGVTVEKKTATLRLNSMTINLVDLPGAYSLTPYTEEEAITRDFLINEKPDLIVDVVDSTNFERNLYFTIQLLELGIPIIMALNIYDEAKKMGLDFDIEKLEQILGIKIVPTVAVKKKGIKELLLAINEVGSKSPPPKKLSYGDYLEPVVEIIEQGLNKVGKELIRRYPLRWLALKLLEGDEFALTVTGLKGNESFFREAKSRLSRLGNQEEVQSFFAEIRYGIAKKIADDVIRSRPERKVDFTEKIDRVVLNRFLALPIFLAGMWFVFKFSFGFSAPFSDWIEFVISDFFLLWATHILEKFGTTNWLTSLVAEGVIQGVGAVVAFIPPIGAITFMMTLLEGSGYLARVAFIMDRFMRSIGLHGRSFIPMILGFGCNVPAIYATRVLETERDRKLTAFLIPFMSCGARLPVYVIFVGTFFPDSAPTVLWSLYLIGILAAILVGYLLKKTLYRGFLPPFVMELPPYRVPLLRDLAYQTWQKLKHFVVKAGTYILAMSIVMWFLLNVPYGVEKEKSILGMIGKTISPVFTPLGFGTWEANASLLSGIMAKEVIVSTMAQIYGLDEDEAKEAKDFNFSDNLAEIGISFTLALREASENLVSFFEIGSPSSDEEGKCSPLKRKIKDDFTPLSAYSFLVFVLLYWPCVVVGIAMRNEFGSFKIYGQALLIHFAFAYLTAFLVYQGGKILSL
ncbi:MAG: ferrous iron transport protein B [Deltaproteobacteria bacterium]|nr:ferrous iron transport protein B [Deltaproteobacteria bacterium]